MCRDLGAVDSGTTDVADDVLRVSPDHHRDAELAAREGSEFMFRMPLALVLTARILEENDFVVRTVVGLSVLMCLTIPDPRPTAVRDHQIGLDVTDQVLDQPLGLNRRLRPIGGMRNKE